MGTWTHLWTGEVVIGPRTTTVAAPTGYPAVFIDANDLKVQEFLSNLELEAIDRFAR